MNGGGRKMNGVPADGDECAACVSGSHATLLPCTILNSLESIATSLGTNVSRATRVMTRGVKHSHTERMHDVVFKLLFSISQYVGPFRRANCAVAVSLC